MQPLFKDQQHQKQFEEEGYVVVKLLDFPAVNKCIEFYQNSNLKGKNNAIFRVGSDHTDKSVVDKMTEFILKETRPELDNVLIDYQTITASYIVKHPDSHGTINPHQDWSFVEDEDEHCSMTCWIPLLDVSLSTGCMGAIKGSQHIFKNIRPSPMPYVNTPLSPHNELLISYLHMIPMKAGEALFFNHRAIHGSLPNTSKHSRNALAISIAHKHARLVHYFLNPEKEHSVLMYPSDPLFYKHYDNFILKRMYEEKKVPENQLVLAEKPYKILTLSKEELETQLEIFKNKKSFKIKFYLNYVNFLSVINKIKGKLLSKTAD